MKGMERNETNKGKYNKTNIYKQNREQTKEEKKTYNNV
jgi:hypothetical protein